MIPLWKRILIEKRAAILALAIGLLANVAAYALWVYPLGVKTATAADRAVAATQSLRAAEQDLAAARALVTGKSRAEQERAAEQDLAAARALVTGKSRAEQELATFYDKVLPADFPSARRLTYATLPDIARKANVKMIERREERDDDKQQKESPLGVLQIRTVWEGDYESLRRFIYELESDPAFVIIDDVEIVQSDPAKPLTLHLTLSAYYRQGANGN